MASESQSKTALAYRNRMSSRFDHWLFFIVFVIGSGGIIALKELDHDQWSIAKPSATPMSAAPAKWKSTYHTRQSSLKGLICASGNAASLRKEFRHAAHAAHAVDLPGKRRFVHCSICLGVITRFRSLRGV